MERRKANAITVRRRQLCKRGCEMREYEDQEGLDATTEVAEAQSCLEQDARFVLTVAAALVGPTASAEMLRKGVTLARDAYFSLISDEAFAELSTGARGGSAIPRLLGCRPLDRRS